MVGPKTKPFSPDDLDALAARLTTAAKSLKTIAEQLRVAGVTEPIQVYGGGGIERASKALTRKFVPSAEDKAEAAIAKARLRRQK